MAINFNAQFIVNEKTATRVLRLTDTSTGFTLAKGNFSVTFPDGSQILHTDFVSPDISAPGGYVDIALITDIDNTVLTGTYVINFVALNGSSTEYTLQRTFDFNWEKPIKAISNQSDVVLPDIRFVDSTPYETSGNFTGTLTRNFYTTTPSTSEVGVITKSTSTDVLIPSNASKYYEGIYLVKSDISVAYTHSSYSWLTVTYTDLLQETYDIREAPTQDELVALMNEYKDQIEAYKTTNPDEYERRNEEYDLVVALYSHIIARFQTGTLDGCKPILDQLLGLLPPTNPYTYKATQMLPFSVNFTTSLSGSGTAGNIAKFTGGTSIGDSIIKEDTGKIGIGKTPTTTLDVNGAIQGTSIIKSGGTSSQFLKADGSVDSNAYLTGVSWGGITGTLSNQTDLQNALNAKFDDPTGTTTQYIDGTGALQTFPVAGTAGTLIREVRNNTGATLTKGTIVYISGALGNKPVVSKAIATGDSTSAQTFGFCQADIPNNTTGYLVCSGDLIGLDTQAIPEGTQLYLSSTTAGAYTSTKQYAPAHLVYVGIVTRSHPTLGQIEVKIQNGYELDELHNVAAQTPSNNDALFYETATSLWKNKTIAAVLGYTPVDASLTENYVPKATGATTLANSNIQDSGSLITLGSNTYVNGSLGIGTSDLTAYNLRINKNITGATTSYSILTEGTIQSDVTNARMFNSKPATVDSTFTITNLSHYLAQQGTFGASSTVTSQYGFFVDTSLIGAANNYAFYSSIAAATGRWNLYMNGTANNYLAGALGIGSTSLTGYGLRLALPITGSISSVGFFNSGIIQSDVTSSTYYNRTSSATAAESFTLTNIYHYGATQGTFGAGSTVTNQYGFLVASSLTGATNNYAFAGQLAAATNVWNLYMAGTANNYLAGSLGIGSTTLTGINLRLGKFITGSVSSHGVFQDGQVQSDVTSDAYGFRNTINTQAASFNLTNYWHFTARQATIGAGSSVTSQQGFHADSTLIGATNNYGFRGSIPLGTNRWNLYMDGTASNYLAGSLGIGSTALTGYNLKVSKNITGSTSAYGISSEGAVQSDVTTQAVYFASNASTAAASFTVPIIAHFSAVQGTFGAGSSVTTQYGYFVSSSMTGATNNHAFRGGLTSGTGRWNIYMDGDAENYILGNVGIGVSASRVSSGPILTSTLTNGGSGYVDGTYTDVAVTVISSNGAGALYTIVVSGGVVTSATLTWAGTSYKVGNTITVSNTLLGGTGSGLIITVDTVDSSPLKISNVNGGDITLYRSDTSLTTGENYGTIKWEGNDTSTKASGIQAEIGAFAQGTTGGAYLSFYTSTGNGGALTEQLRIGSGGQVGIGATTLTGYNLRVSKNITGAITSNGIVVDGAIQSDVTSSVRSFYTNISTAASAFTLINLYHFIADQSTIGAGSSVTNQYGFYTSTTLTGATNNYGFYGNIASGTNRWNLYLNGTANNYMAGSLGIGSTSSLATINLRMSKSITGGTVGYGIYIDSAIQSDITSAARGVFTILNTAASAFTLNNLYHFQSTQGTFGAGSTVTSQYGFQVSSNLIGATNNYGFYGDIPSGTNRWNLYMAGTADNYLAGSLGIGSTSLANYNLRLTKNITGATTSYAIRQDGVVQSDSTTAAYGMRNDMNTAAASFTVGSYSHYYATEGTIGAGSAVTNQYGFTATSSMTSATNNYGFFGAIAAGTNRWNIYMGGTAQNYLAGALSIGVTTANASALLQVDSTTKGFLPPRMTATQRAAISSPAEGLVVFQTDGTIGLYVYANATWRTLAMV